MLSEAFAWTLMCDNEVLADLAQTYWEMGDEDKARAYADSVLSSRPDTGRMLRLLADYYQKRGIRGRPSGTEKGMRH